MSKIVSRNRLIILFFALICTLSLFSKVRVLSVCVGSYPPESGWTDLSSTNDNHSISSIFSNVSSLIDADATFKNFTQELIAFGNKSNIGDTIIIHFSGHGQQILTPASISESDHVDEAMVPFDAAKNKSSIYHGENHLTDDIFGRYVTAIRKKLGPRGLVIAVIDACHSDSMDKNADDSSETYRGTEDIFGTESLSEDSVQSLRNYYYANDKSSIVSSDDMAEAIFIGACQTHQRNYEIKKNGKQHGSLTYYFCKVVKESGLSNMEVLLNDLYSEMTADNTMKFHGQRPNIRTTFGWKSPEPEAYIPQNIQQIPAEDCCGWEVVVCAGIGVILVFIIGLIVWKRKR